MFYPIDRAYLDRGNVIVPAGISTAAPANLWVDLVSFYRRNVLLPKEDLLMLATFCWASWFYDIIKTAPYLYVLGEHGTAKTRIKDLLAATCFNSADLGTSVTPASIFRMQDLVRGTLFLDEVEMKFSDRQHDMVQILNEGYKSGGVVIRNEQLKHGYKPTAYAVYGPKAVISRSEPEDISLRSRFFILRTSRLTGDEIDDAAIPLDFTNEADIEAQGLRNRLLWARFSNYQKLPKLRDDIKLKAKLPRDRQLIRNMLSVLPWERQPDLCTMLEAHLYIPIDQPEKAVPQQIVLAIKGVVRSYGRITTEELYGKFRTAVTKDQMEAVLTMLEQDDFLKQADNYVEIKR